MKPFSLSLLVFVLYGCGSRSEFAVTPDQIQKRVVKGSGGPIDLNHLPPGAVTHVRTFKKGDRLPDGTIADGNRKLVTVEVDKPGGN